MIWKRQKINNKIRKKAIESKAVTQSTNEATQTEEISKTKNNPEKTNKPRGKVLKTTAKKQSQMEAQNRKRKIQMHRVVVHKNEFSQQRKKGLYLKMIQVLQQKTKKRRGNLF